MAWIVLACIIGLIVLLLSFSICLHVSIKDDVHISVHYMFLTLWDSKKPKKINPKKEAEKQAKKEAEKAKKDAEKKAKKANKKDKTKPKEPPQPTALDKLQKMRADVRSKLDKITGIGKKKSSSSKSDESSTPTNTDANQKPSFTDTIYFILDMVNVIIPEVKKLCLGVRITNLKIDMSISCENADKTAIVHTLTSATIQNTIAYLSQMIKVKIKKVHIVPDFTTEEWHQDVFFKVKISIFVILSSVFGIVINFFKSKPTN